jgi:DNA-directed RNA polymerase subunit N (RpoN/RPB10)
MALTYRCMDCGTNISGQFGQYCNVCMLRRSQQPQGYTSGGEETVLGTLVMVVVSIGLVILLAKLLFGIIFG